MSHTCMQQITHDLAACQHNLNATPEITKQLTFHNQQSAASIFLARDKFRSSETL